MTPVSVKPKLAFWFRYGAAEHTELYHALPDLFAALAEHVEIHYWGMKSDRTIPERICRHAVIHEIPIHVRRTSNRDKMLKTFLWMVLLPWVALHTRRLGIKSVFIDETIPFSVWTAQRFVGPHVAVTVADFFVDIYLAPHAITRPLARWIRRFDINTWKNADLVITRARATRDYLSTQGIDPGKVLPIYDPCDETVFYPMDKADCRKEFGYTDEDVVLVHHGILHPNKGNDLILTALARLKTNVPQIKYLLVGDGPDMPRLQAMVAGLGLEKNVKLTGWLPGRNDVNRALNAGDIGLVMRVGHESDNFHMTGALVHAMACGLPILAARLGGISEAVREEHNGMLFDPVCQDEFDEKVKRMVDDSPGRRRMGEAAYRDSRELFSMESVIRQTVDALKEFTCKGAIT